MPLGSGLYRVQLQELWQDRCSRCCLDPVIARLSTASWVRNDIWAHTLEAGQGAMELPPVLRHATTGERPTSQMALFYGAIFFIYSFSTLM
jgi:hypothetical protein